MKFLKHRAFPSFYKDYAPKLVEFFGLWVDWLNKEENAAYIVDHLSSEQDIDESVNAYASHIKNKLLDEFPSSIASDLRLLLKNIYFLYNSKSSINSYEFLFRCLFDSPCSIRYPKEYILKTSDGRWQIPVYLQTKGYDIISQLWQYNWFKLEGDESHATCYIDGADIIKNDNDEFENCLRVTSVLGTFIPDEHLTMTDPSTGATYDFDIYVKKYVINYEAGRWMDTHGLLDSDMVIQDSYYYQDFSYIIRSSVPMNKWKALVKKIIHPAGLGLFGELLTAGTDEASGNPLTLAVNPVAFISMFHMWLKLYVLSATAALQSATWHIEDSQILQNRSETPDIWIHRGFDFVRDGFYWLNTGYATTFFNRDSVMLFRDDGTLIDPDLIDWSLMKFKDDIATRTLTGITLHPWKPLDKGEIVGNTWTPKAVVLNHKLIGDADTELLVTVKDNELELGNLCLEDDPLTIEERENLSEMMIEDNFTNTLDPESNESYVYKRFMVFTTQANGDTSKVIKDLRLPDEYITSNNEEKTIRSTGMQTIAEIPVNKYVKWTDLTVKDSVTVSLEQMEIYPEGSLVKVPDEYIALENGGYRFIKRHYNHEKIFIFSYSEDDISEHHFFENRDKEANHVFSLSANPIDESILLFIDGKFSKNYIVEETELIIPISDYNTAELYILGRTIGQRRQEEHYRGDRWFVYNNARKWPFMPCNYHIKTTHAIDYHLWTGLEIDKSYFKIAWNTMFSQPASINSSEMWQELCGIAQNHSITFDEWLNRGEYKSSNSWNKIVTDFNKISNKNSTLVFTENGILIDPENINWAEKRISDYADNSPHSEAIIAVLEEMSQTLYRWTAYSTAGQKTYDLNGSEILPSNRSFDYHVTYSSVTLDPADYTINRFSKQITFAESPRENNYPIVVKFIGDPVDISDIENKYGNFIYSLPILAEKTRIEFTLENKAEFTLSVPSKVVGASDMLQSVAVNEENAELGNLEMKSTPMTMENREDLGSVLMTDSFSNTIDTDSEVIRKDYIVFLNGLKVKESDIKNVKNTYIFNEEKTGNVLIYQTSADWKKAYYTGTGKSISIDKSFGEIDPKYIVVFIDGAFTTEWTVTGSTIALKKEPKQWYEVYILNSFAYFQPEKARFDKYALNFTFNNLRKMDIVPSWMHMYLFKEVHDLGKKIEKHSLEHLRSMAIVHNNEMKAMASLNIARPDAEPVIQMFNTLDRLIYDGTQPVLDYSDMPIQELEKEFNRYSTMLFKSDGKIANPEDINWPTNEFENLTLTDSVTPVVLNPEMPALTGILNMTDGTTPNFTPHAEDIIDKNMMVFVTGRKVDPDKVRVENGTVYVSGIESWDVTDTELKVMATVSNTDIVFDGEENDVNIGESTDEQMILTDNLKALPIQVLNEENFVFVKKDNSIKDIVIFQYNPDDLEFMEFRNGSKGRFFTLPRVGFTKKNILVFKNGFRTDDYYISGDMLGLNSLDKTDTVEVYAFKEYDYNFIQTMPHNYKQKTFVLSNIKRLKYI